MATHQRDSAIVRRLVRWFDANARDLPWRAHVGGRRDPYASLVSEAMLQQTQVSRVLEKYEDFMKRFPTVTSLARARDEQVLAAWSGLGYYRRARNLHLAAKQIVERHGGRTPQDVPSLLALAGVGRYTAGAIASIVFNQPAPIVDGNVARALLRIEGERLDPSTRDGSAYLWRRAEELAQRAARAKDASPARFNEGLMELGALVCKPVNPRCGACPLASLCVARERGVIEEIPVAKPSAKVKRVHHECVIVEDERGRRLVERRADGGLWAGMWQPPTLEADGRAPSLRQIEAWLGTRIVRVNAFRHQTSHRSVQFRVWRAAPPAKLDGERVWRTRRQIESLALSNPHRRILLEL